MKNEKKTNVDIVKSLIFSKIKSSYVLSECLSIGTIQKASLYIWLFFHPQISTSIQVFTFSRLCRPFLWSSTLLDFWSEESVEDKYLKDMFANWSQFKYQLSHLISMCLCARHLKFCTCKTQEVDFIICTFPSALISALSVDWNNLDSLKRQKGGECEVSY